MPDVIRDLLVNRAVLSAIEEGISFSSVITFICFDKMHDMRTYIRWRGGSFVGLRRLFFIGNLVNKTYYSNNEYAVLN